MIRESQIQTRIRNGLIKRGWMVIKLIQTSMNGIPDMICHKEGRTMYIEVKRPGEKPTKLQQHRMQQLYIQGIESYYIDDPIKLWNYLDQQPFI